MGSAGSGKTESVVFSFLKHFNKYGFCGVIHDYKHFEITEMAYPLFQNPKVPLHIVSFDDIYERVNPIAPRYMEDEESVNEISRVLLENLLEQKESVASGSSKFFNDAVEGLLGGLIWKLKTAHPDYCTLPHLIATYQYLDTEQLVSFLSSDFTSKAMADAFISGIDSERQTAGVMSTLANALKKISTPRIFMTLSADEIPLDINNPKHPSLI
ncbi:MAG TPA: mobilization protein, partial [Algoriphagus sp.]|nr:mobilization protein [Algoriphagus sp.]